MQIDIVTIFPDFFRVLDIALLGKARHGGLFDVTVHDLRTYAHDRHKTVDDTPYGGGAGMVMKPEPWGEAFDSVLGGSRGHTHDEPESGALSAEPPVIVVPSPAGEVFSQSIARELSTQAHLVFACGRYEGIDERVIDDAADRARVRVLSLGDYVLNGGEVAALAMIEATVRMLPGVLGNPASLVEESHSDGLLEYPLYTKPAVWRGRHVPAVLLSGDHQAIAAWRAERQRERTRRVRPDLAGEE